MDPRREWRAFLAATQFLSRVPIPSGTTGEGWREDLARAPRHFPLAGGLIGLATGALYAAGCLVWPPVLAAAIALAAEAILTGAFHEDAFADYCDAIGGGRTRDETLEILKDSRIGSYGAAGLCLGLAARMAALAALAPAAAVIVCAAAGALARLAIVCAMAAAEPARGRESLARDIGARPGLSALFAAFLMAAPFVAGLVGLLGWQALIGLGALALSTLLLTRQMIRRVGGVVGDGLGTIAFTGQIAVLCACAAR
jgi:adenosylcobinamide-GDP ribazoletransferase